MSSLVDRILSEAAIADRPGQMARLEAIAYEVDGLEARLEAVAALVAPQWRTIPTDLSDVPMEAFVDGRNWMIDLIRHALSGVVQ